MTYVICSRRIIAGLNQCSVRILACNGASFAISGGTVRTDKKGRYQMEEQATMTVEELARYLHIGQNVAYKLVKKPGFPAIRVSPRRIVIPVKQLEAWLEQNAGIGVNEA